MKKTFTIITLLIAGSIAFSQQLNITQFATLNHNDTITAYYGPNALVSAHSAATHGDIITLSPGTFTHVNITKALTIRGAGMFRDTVANTSPTTITGNFYVNVPNSANHHLKMEGLYFSGIMGYYKIYSPQFTKCRFNSIWKFYGSYDFDNTTTILSLPIFTNCLISDWRGNSSVSNAMFINSIINVTTGRDRYLYAYLGTNNTCSIQDYYLYWGDHGQSDDVYYNCIVNIPPNYTNYKRYIINCITYSTDTTIGSGNNVYNTVGITDSTNFYSITTGHNNTNVNGFESIFKTFRGTYTEGEMFELTTSAAATYLGSDNTQVGIYGGSAVFNPKATDMRIRKYSVGFYSDENGQLKITTELENE